MEYITYERTKDSINNPYGLYTLWINIDDVKMNDSIAERFKSRLAERMNLTDEHAEIALQEARNRGYYIIGLTGSYDNTTVAILERIKQYREDEEMDNKEKGRRLRHLTDLVAFVY